MTEEGPVTSRALSRRTFLKTAAAGAAAATGVSLFNINHAWSQDVVYTGEVFDAGGAELVIADWGSFWEELMRKAIINDFEKAFNCKIVYDSASPWFPKFAAQGPKNPAFAVTNFNYGEMFKTAAAGDYFVPLDEMVANMPNAAGLWPFATANGIGITWAYTRYCYGYRTDMSNPAPASFKDFWAGQFANKRGSYTTSNGLLPDFFLATCQAFGKDQYDLEAGYQAMRDAMPMKLSDFTGNMQTLLERGEVAIGVQHDAEIYGMMDRGIAVAPYIWDDVQPILTQVKTVSRYLEPTQKKLAYALVDRFLDPKFHTVMGTEMMMRPTHSAAEVSANLAAKGVTNTADAVDGYWTPDWKFYVENEQDIVETLNEIYSA